MRPSRAALVVVEERRRPLTAGDVQLRSQVVVAVEDGDATAREEADVAVVGVDEPGGGGLVREHGRPARDGRRRARTEHQRPHHGGDRDERQHGDGPGDPPHPPTSPA